MRYLFLLLISFGATLFTGCDHTGNSHLIPAKIVEGKPMPSYVNMPDSLRDLYSPDDTVWVDLGTHRICDSCRDAAAVVLWPTK